MCDSAVGGDKESMGKSQDNQPKSPWLTASVFLFHLFSSVVVKAHKFPLVLGKWDKEATFFSGLLNT